MWKYITTEDMNGWVKELKYKNKNLYWKLSAQCRARIPMTKVAYIKLKKKYTDEQRRKITSNNRRTKI